MGKTVIFDIDGTLLNTETVYMRAWAKGAEAHGYHIPWEALQKTRAIAPKIAAEIFKSYCGQDFPYDTIKEDRIAISEEMIAQATPEDLWMPGAVETLQWLKAQGYTLAAASSTAYKRTVEHLEHADLLAYFSVIVCGDMVERGKPAPDIFQKAAALAGAEPEECVVVGDTPADVLAASAAGIRVVLIPDQVPANEQTTALSWKILDSLKELPLVLESETKNVGDNDMKKITVIGDIMVEPPFMEQIGKAGGYDFTPSLLPLKGLLDEADYVIGNLETPLAGEEAGYTSRIVSFNAPDTLADALKTLGVDAVSTCNNHSVDRGYEGMVRTIRVLDKVGIAHTGTYEEGFAGDRIHYFTVGDTKVALLAYTYATNYDINGVEFTGDRKACINMLRPQHGGSKLYAPMPQHYFDTLALMKEVAGRELLWEETIKLKIAMGLPVPVIDNLVNEPEQDLYYRQVEADYDEARKNADIVLFYPHVGGQFNELPGKYTMRLAQKCADTGFDAVFAAHSHTSQKAEFLGQMPCFYSMGNVTMSPGTFYSVSECLPEYGLAAHLYIENKRIAKVTFSIFKMVEENGEPLRVVPVDALYEELTGQKQQKLAEDVAVIYERVIGAPPADRIPLKEYDLCK